MNLPMRPFQNPSSAAPVGQGACPLWLTGEEEVTWLAFAVISSVTTIARPS
jgi:hypothetical protein